MAKSPKVKRTKDNLLAALRKHLGLLQEFSGRAFQNRDPALLGEVAGKLRLLAYSSRTNHPLLLDAMKEAGIEIPVTIDKPGGGYTTTLPKYLDGSGMIIETPSRGKVAVKKGEFIALWAHQIGAAHEDPEISEELAAAFKPEVMVNGLPLAAALLKAIATTVLTVGTKFLAELDARSAGESPVI